MINEYLTVLIFFIVALGFTVGGLVFAYFVRESNPSLKKSETYECGEEAVGSAWIQFNMRYYFFAIIYVIFAVEAMFLYPWAVTFRELGLFSFLEMTVFLGVLIVGLAYAWVKGALRWE